MHVPQYCSSYIADERQVRRRSAWPFPGRFISARRPRGSKALRRMCARFRVLHGPILPPSPSPPSGAILGESNATRTGPNGGKNMGKVYDAIIVGARCAGSPTAMLLARKGYRVLLVDRATFPSDTVSTHVVQPLARGRALAMGAARPSGGDRMPADRHLHLRLRSLHDRRRTRHKGCSGRVLPATDRSRQAPRRCCRRGRRRGPRGLHRR